jgi:sterol O-acyltransferase
LFRFEIIQEDLILAVDNGHLSEEYKIRAALQNKLKQLDNVAPAETPSAMKPKFSQLEYLDAKPRASDLNQRRQSRAFTNEEGATNIDQVAAAIESGESLDIDQIHIFERIIKWEIDALTQDLTGKCTRGDNIYPHNLTISNHYEYIVLPTLVYELEYPRSENINWYYVAEKTAAVFGVLAVMNLISQAFIYPVVVRTIEMKDSGMLLQERLEKFPWILSDLIFPFMMEYMMVSVPMRPQVPRYNLLTWLDRKSNLFPKSICCLSWRKTNRSPNYLPLFS